MCAVDTLPINSGCLEFAGRDGEPASSSSVSTITRRERQEDVECVARWGAVSTTAWSLLLRAQATCPPVVRLPPGPESGPAPWNS